MPHMQAARSTRQPRTSVSHSDPLPHRSDLTAKPMDYRPSGFSARSGFVNQRKLGTHIADLESRLGQAQKELKHLKGQLASSEVTKKDALTRLEKRTTYRKTTSHSSGMNELGAERLQETNAFAVPMAEQEIVKQVEEMLFDDSVLKDDEITSLRSKLEERGEELEVARQARESLKSRLDEASSNVSSARSKEEETTSRLTQVAEELESSRGNVIQLEKKLEHTEEAKRTLEEEMKELRSQTEKWKSAADAAAELIAAGVEGEATRISGRHGSMGKRFSLLFETSFNDYSEVADDFGREYQRSSGFRMFGDLWKRTLLK